MSLLEQHFDVAFAAPDGIKKLRELILTLAMQGKLVPQDPNDEPASELLKSIKVEKNRLTKEGKHKKSLSLPEIDHDELPYQLPKSWEWVRLGHLFRVTSGNNLTKDKMQEGSFPVYGGNGIAGYHDEFNTERPTIVIGRVGYYCGSIHLTPERAWITDNAFFTIYDEERLYQGFVIWLLKTINLQVDTSATAQPVISGGKIYPILIPLPPLAEQRRIVAKIDQLMARCDELEKLRIDRSQRLLTVHTAALDRLLTANDSSEFGTAWSFITQHFGELYSVKENVVELRKTILQLAVMGKLVQQDPHDEPASELLKSIELEKQRLVKEGKIKKSKLVPAFTPEEIPYELPKGWQWSNIQNISLKVTDGEHITPQRSLSGYYLLSARNVTNNGIKLDDVDYVPKEEYERIRKRCNPEIGDILVSCSGSVGRIAIVDADNYVMVRSVALIKHEHNFLLSSFLENALKSPIVQSQIVDKSRTTAQSNLFLGKINEILIPLPPLAEQGRIVEKIDRLMGMCDRLEGSIESAKNKQTDLLNALMAQV
jgi:type I restriction enzyme, S subunit